MSSGSCATYRRPAFEYPKSCGRSATRRCHTGTLAEAMSAACFPSSPMAPMLRPDASKPTLSFSKTVTAAPRRASSQAVASPEIPAPTTITSATVVKLHSPLARTATIKPSLRNADRQAAFGQARECTVTMARLLDAHDLESRLQLESMTAKKTAKPIDG